MRENWPHQCPLLTWWNMRQRIPSPGFNWWTGYFDDRHAVHAQPGVGSGEGTVAWSGAAETRLWGAGPWARRLLTSLVKIIHRQPRAPARRVPGRIASSPVNVTPTVLHLGSMVQTGCRIPASHAESAMGFGNPDSRASTSLAIKDASS